MHYSVTRHFTSTITKGMATEDQNEEEGEARINVSLVRTSIDNKLQGG